jgi:hypothetical protein
MYIFEDNDSSFSTSYCKPHHHLQHQQSTKSNSPEKSFIIPLPLETKRLRLNSDKIEVQKAQHNYLNKVKTEMCKNWESQRYCPFGNKVDFIYLGD